MNFSLIGAAGYVAPRHMQAISDVGGNLYSAYDPFDSVGILDRYFPHTHFFSEFEPFYLELIKRKTLSDDPSYVSICSPNYLHNSHAELAMQAGADVICEKPICLNSTELKSLIQTEKETGRKVNCILQLRLHPEVLRLRQLVLSGNDNKVYDVDLEYITSRGNWYAASWKNDINKSGGILQNIGVHFFDMLTYIFGDVLEKKVFFKNDNTLQGFIKLDRARVRWLLSVDQKYLPNPELSRTYRNISIDGQNFELSKGFTDLHTESYQQIVKGNGFGLITAAPSISLTEDLKNEPISIGDTDELIREI